MGYLLILITVLLNISKGACSKKISTKIACMAENVNLCFVRNLVCVILGAFIIMFGGIDPSLPLNGILICILSGISMTFNYIVWLKALKGEAYMLANTANNASFVIAAVCGVVIFAEQLTVTKCGAFLLIAIAMFFMTRYQTKLYKKPSLHDFTLLGLVFITAGTNSVCQKLFTTYVKGYSVTLFTFYTFVISCFLLLVMRPLFKANSSAKKQAKKIISLLPFILFMGLALYGATFFQAQATFYVDSVILYPLNSSLSILGSGIMAWILFSEKPSKDSIIGAIFVIAALVLSRF